MNSNKMMVFVLFMGLQISFFVYANDCVNNVHSNNDICSNISANSDYKQEEFVESIQENKEAMCSLQDSCGYDLAEEDVCLPVAFEQVEQN